MRFLISRHSTHALEPSAIIVRGAFRAIIQAEYRCCGANGTLAAQQCFLAREKANNIFSLIERDDNARCKGNGAAGAGDMFAYCVRSPGRVPSIASQEALMQFGSEHLQFD